MNLPTDQQEKRRVLAAFAALRGNPSFETIIGHMKTDLAGQDALLRSAPISEELGKTQGRALYAADFLALCDTAAQSVRALDKASDLTGTRPRG